MKPLMTLIFFLFMTTKIYASWQDVFSKGMEILNDSTTTSQSPSLSQDYQTQALKKALSLGVDHAVKELTDQGFLNHPTLKIPMPDSLKTITSFISKIGGKSYVEEFVTTMNLAAGKAVPESASIFANTIKTMSINDAVEIIKGKENAATTYFKDKTHSALIQTITPIVKEATASNRLTSSYQAMMNFYNQNKSALPNSDLLGQAKGIASALGLGDYLPMSDEDLNAYVTRKTLDGVFWMIAEEEKKIRQNPMAYSSELIQKVFGK